MGSLKRVFSLRLADPVFNKLEYLAKLEHRSLTNLIEFALLNYIDQYENLNGSIPDYSND